MPAFLKGRDSVVLLFFGPPGSGKGTQSKRIAEWMGIPAISTGEMFRSEVAAGTPLGREAQEVMSRGGLMGDEIVNRMLESRLRQESVRGGCLLDGYPRTLAQAEHLDELLVQLGMPEPTVLHLDVPRQALVERMSGRRHCGLCGRDFNVFTQPPRIDGVCDADGVRLETRDDDAEAVVSERLRQYELQTGPLIGYYRGRDYHRVDGNRSADVVFRDLVGELESRLVRVRGQRR